MSVPRCCLVVLCLASVASCRAPQLQAPARELAAIRATLDELYAAFDFDAGEQPDWRAQRAIYLTGAAFVTPIRTGRTPVVQDTAAFLTDFEGLATSLPLRNSGFHERIIGTSIDVFGGVAHAFVAFEGFVPGDGRVVTRGLDSIQLVHDGETWRLVSFTTQYEDDGLLLPERFLGAEAGDR